MGEGKRFGQEQRLTFRIAVRGRVDLDAWLLLAGKKLPAIVVDVSAEGMLVKLERGPLAALKVGNLIDVVVEFEGETFALHGVIRSEHAGGYGVFFPERDARGRANPLGRFARIWVSLQRTSLSQRLKVLKLPE
jgi:PilZ domain